MRQPSCSGPQNLRDDTLRVRGICSRELSTAIGSILPYQMGTVQLNRNLQARKHFDRAREAGAGDYLHALCDFPTSLWHTVPAPSDRPQKLGSFIHS